LLGSENNNIVQLSHTHIEGRERTNKLDTYIVLNYQGLGSGENVIFKFYNEIKMLGSPGIYRDGQVTGNAPIIVFGLTMFGVKKKMSTTLVYKYIYFSKYVYVLIHIVYSK
jgi:hypothetical protein